MQQSEETKGLGDKGNQTAIEPTIVVDGKLNPDWIAWKECHDELTARIKGYFLSGPSIMPNCECTAKPCLFQTRAPLFHDIMTQKTKFSSMMLCFTCNRVSHVKCNLIDLEAVRTEPLPWQCKDCREDVNNPHATRYRNLTSYSDSLRNRRKYFLRLEKSADDGSVATDDEFPDEDIEGDRWDATWTPYQTACELEKERSEKSQLLEELHRLKTQKPPVSPSRHDRHSASKKQDEFKKNSTSLGGISSNAFNFSGFYNQQEQPPASEQAKWTYNPQPPRIHISNTFASGSESTSRVSDADITQLMHRFTIAHERSVAAQERAAEEESLKNARKVTPKLPSFDGDPDQWLEFSRKVARYQQTCKYDEETMKMTVHGALKGEAAAAVNDIIDFATLSEVMAALRKDFGNPQILVRNARRALENVKLSGKFTCEEAKKIKYAIQAYFASCAYAKIGCVNSNMLAEAIFDQLPEEHQIRLNLEILKEKPGEHPAVDLNRLYNYILALQEALPLGERAKPASNANNKREKPNQVNFAGTSHQPNKGQEENFRFRLLDVTTAPYMGYDLQKVGLLKKHCTICGKAGHYPLQCDKYKGMSLSQRQATVTEKKLCSNCVLTDAHQASQCDVKRSCGHKSDRQRCSGKHHISLHQPKGRSRGNNNNFYRRPNKGNTDNNTNRARQAFNDAPKAGESSGTQQSSNQPKPAAANFLASDPQQYDIRSHANQVSTVQVNLHSALSYQKTVKVFKHDFHGPNGIITAFSVGDSGAEVTLVRDDLREALGIKGEPDTLNITWTDSSSKLCPARRFDMVVCGIHENAERQILRDCYSIDDLNLPRRTLDMKSMRSKFPYLKGIDFDGYIDERPVMLIGTTHAYITENSGRMRGCGPGKPIAIEAKLGFSVFGGDPIATSSSHCSVQVVGLENDDTEASSETSNSVSNDDLHELLKKFNSIESLGISAKEHHLAEDERKAIEIMQEEMRILDDGSIEVPLIWNRDHAKQIPKLDNNYVMAFKRQLSLEKKLLKEPAHHKAYNDNVKELIALGYLRHAEESDLNGEWDNIWYLPMGLVVNANKDPPKFRNIYDARAKYNGRSLNDLLLKGQDLLISLVKPLIKLRLSRVAFCADIKHMFHRMRICHRDQQVQRVLWRESTDQPMNIMILSVMAFGPNCSPFVSQYVKNWNADRWAVAYPDAAKAAKELIYMDDVLISVPNVQQATQLAKQLIDIFGSIKWDLVAFQSNSKEFLKQIPGERIKKEIIPILTEESDEHITKVLGSSWSTTDDAFVYQLDKNLFVRLITEREYEPTKRDLTSLIARIFDIMGFIAHYTIRGKIILQRTWKLKIGWDDKVPPEILTQWKDWLKDIENISRLKIARTLSTCDALDQADKVELHSFCDAGVEAFGAAVYLVTHKNGVVESNLVMAKAKVTPLRFHTETEIKEIPRLELLSALIAARLAKTVMEALDGIAMEKHYWSDSEVVLRWILNPNHRLLKYAVAPIEEILETSQRSEWRYVPSALNPADTCTKFKEFDFADSKSAWFVGPEYLKQQPNKWPELPAKLTAPEASLVYNIYLEQLNYSSHELPPDFATYRSDECIDKLSEATKGNWNKLRRAVARGVKIWMDGFIPLVKSKSLHDSIAISEIKKLHSNFKFLSPSDFERAEHFIFRKLQRENFPIEYRALQENRPIRNTEFARVSAFMDPQGLIRINSRANLNDISFPQQFAPLLPRKSEVVYALLRSVHIQYGHIALETQIAAVRTRCWIPRLRAALKVTKARCNECKLRDKQLYEPPMAPLPTFRIDPAQRPFEVVALDCFGPYMVKCSGRYKKIWVLIFCCTLTRFVHLHILESLESLRVLEAIAVFWATHGPVSKLVSDNGLNFVGAARTLKEDYQNAQVFLNKQHALLQPKLSEKYEMDWEFIPPYSPWMGGVYERLIKEIKRALYDILHKPAKNIDKIELNIAIHEASHRLNCRPLTYNSVSSDDDIVLTPFHLAKNYSGFPSLPGIHKGRYAKVNDKDLYRKGRALADKIMSKFTANYLPEYARRTKWYQNKREIKLNDLVLIVDPQNTRREWQRGRVVKIRQSRDGRGRKADVRLADGRIKLHSVRNLARLDISV